MKALTIKQPWATLIKEGYKEYEFRTWKTSYRGEIYIHAGKGIDREAMKRFSHLNLDYPSGCIIAKAKLVDCILVDDEFRRMAENKDSLVYQNIICNSSWTGYGFQLSEVEKINPIPAKGKLSFWEYSPKEK